MQPTYRGDTEDVLYSLRNPFRCHILSFLTRLLIGLALEYYFRRNLRVLNAGASRSRLFIYLPCIFLSENETILEKEKKDRQVNNINL